MALDKLYFASVGTRFIPIQVLSAYQDLSFQLVV